MNGVILLAANKAQRLQFAQSSAQGLMVPDFQLGTLVMEIDTQILYYWNGNSYEVLAATGGSGPGVASLNALTGALNIVAGSNITVTPLGQNITIAGSSSGTGTVTSVALTAPSYFTVSGSPITTSGTLAITGTSQSANQFLASPNGSSGVLSPRSIVAADIPTLNQNTTGTASNVTGIVAVTNGGTGLTSPGTSGNVLTSNGTAWVSSTPAVSTPGGTSGQVQFNNGGVFGGFGSWNGTTLNITGNIIASGTLFISGSSQFNGNILATSGLGVTGNLGFYGATQISQPSGNIITALQNLGLVSGGSLSSANIPNNAANTTGTASNITATSNSTLTTLSSLSLPYSQVTGTPTFADSIVNTAGTITLVNDTASPSASQYYGTNGSSILGYYNLPSTSGITALTGDGTATGPGSATFTLATVNSNTGTFGSSTLIPSFTVNGKGLITAASTNPVIAPAGTLSGTTLNSTVVNSSLTSVGTITTGVWNGTTIAIANGGTGQTTAAAAFGALSPLTTAGDIIIENNTPAPARLPIGTSGQVLTVVSGLPAWQTPSSSGGTVTSVSVVTANGLAGTVATATTTPAITLSTTITGVLKGNGTAISAAVAGTDYVIPSGSITGTASNITATSNSTLTTLSALSLPFSQVTGTVPVAQGGTGDTSFTAYALIAGGTTSTGSLQSIAAGTPGYVLTYNSSSSLPTWQPAPGTVSSFFASSQVTTISTQLTAGTFTTFSNSPAFTFTPTITGTYKVYSGASIYVSGNGGGKVRIFNTSGSATLLEESDGNFQNFTGGGSVGFSDFIQSTYTLTAGTSYQFDIQGSAASGGVYLDGGDSPFYMFAELETASAPASTFSSITVTGLTGYMYANGASAVTAATTIPGSAINGFTQGSVIFAGASGQLTQDNANFYWNDTNFSLGISNSAPSSAAFIDAVNTSGATKRVLLTGYGSASLVGFRTRLARGTSGSPTAVQAGDILGFYNCEGYGTSQFPSTATGALTFYANETFTNTSNQTYATINATPTGAVVSAEAFRVAATGVTLGPQSSSTAIHANNGGLSLTTRTITANLTIDTTTTDYYVLCNASGAITVTLPTPTAGRTLIIKDISGSASTNNITIAPHASENIEGLSSSYLIQGNYQSVNLMSDGTNWWLAK